MVVEESEIPMRNIKKNLGCRQCKHIRFYEKTSGMGVAGELCGIGGITKYDDPINGPYVSYVRCIFKNKNCECTDFEQKKNKEK